MNASNSSPNSIAKWLPAIAAAGLLGTVVVAGVALGGDGGGADAVPTPELADPAFITDSSVTQLSIPDEQPAAVASVATTAPVTKTALDRTLSKGVAGDDVKRVQERLSDLGFVPGPADGIYGDQTIKSVWAYEKLVMDRPANNPTGQVTPEMWDEMQDPFVIQPRRPNATEDHTEVYLPQQVLAVFHDDVPVMITHMSSGSNEQWCEEVTISPGEYGNREGTEPLIRGECGVSTTPGGVFTFYRQVEGVRQSALGGMWNPVYFNYGIAIHGALNVPLQGASHGCIRIPLNISESLQDLVNNGDQVFVWDGVEEPEAYGAQPPRFNWRDPDYVDTSTTSSTTTTVPETTVPETTTTVAAPDTTAAPAPQTTTTTGPSTTTTTTTTTVLPPETTTTSTPSGGSDGGGDDGLGDTSSDG